MEYPKSIYGYVLIGEQKFAFALNNFHLRIFNGITGFTFPQERTLENVLFGLTDDNYNIAIKIGKPQQSTNCIVVSVYYFVIGTANLIYYDLSKFDKISFIGGNINSIINPTIAYENDFIFDYYEKPFSIKFKPIKDVTYSIRTKINNVDVKFERTIYPYQKRKDNNLGITNSVLSFEFQKSQDISSLDNWIIFVSRLISLLIGQKNVECESCSILFKANQEKGNAKVYFNLGHKEKCEKSPVRCISLVRLDNHLENLFKIVNDANFSIGFLPETNEDAKYVTYDDIKNICTALEFEYGISDISKQKNEDIKELVDKVKFEVKSYRETTTKLSDKFYQYIYSNISTWQCPAVEKFISLLNENETLIRNVLKDKNEELCEDDIQKFVKCRNCITHGEKPVLDSHIAKTAFSLKYVIYIYILKRIGLDDNEIYTLLRFVIL